MKTELKLGKKKMPLRIMTSLFPGEALRNRSKRLLEVSRVGKNTCGKGNFVLPEGII